MAFSILISITKGIVGPSLGITHQMTSVPTADLLFLALILTAW
jgi:hypothetical protein